MADSSLSGTPAPALRSLAHPLRSRMLAELRVNGQASGADLARALGTHTGATSYHLRRLEAVGLVEDTGTGNGRSRVWRAVPQAQPHPDDDAPQDADEAAVADWLAQDYLAHFHDRAQRWLADRGQWPASWSHSLGLEDHLALVTAEQLTALRAELVEVLERYRRLGQGNPQAKRVVVYSCALPVDPLTTPGRRA